MKTLLTILTVFFTVMFSPPSYAEWTKVSKNVTGATIYVDLDRMRKVDGYVYYWALIDLPKPDEDGDLSYKSYKQADCKLFRMKDVSASFHKEPMGGGPGESVNAENPKWEYPPPNTIGESMLKLACRE